MIFPVKSWRLSHGSWQVNPAVDEELTIYIKPGLGNTIRVKKNTLHVSHILFFFFSMAKTSIFYAILSFENLTDSFLFVENTWSEINTISQIISTPRMRQFDSAISTVQFPKYTLCIELTRGTPTFWGKLYRKIWSKNAGN